LIADAAAPDIPGPELTAEEVVTLEQEGRAALHEMGESLPDLGDNVVPFAAPEKPGPYKADKPEKAAPTPKKNSTVQSTVESTFSNGRGDRI
jgi:hypothetical protein